MTGQSSSRNGGDTGHDHNSQNRLNHLLYTVAGLALATIIDVVFLWPTHHLFALLSIGAVLTVIAISELRYFNKSRRWQFMAILVIWVSCLTTGLLVGPAKIPDIEVTGSLLPANDPITKNVCTDTEADKQGSFVILAGGSVFLAVPGSQKFAAITDGNCPVVSVERDGRNVYIDAQLYENGNLVARIIRNKLHALTGGNYRVDRGPSLSDLQIRNASGKEIFYARYMNPKTLRIRGVFGCKGQPDVVVTDNRITAGHAVFEGMCLAGSTSGLQIGDEHSP